MPLSDKTYLGQFLDIGGAEFNVKHGDYGAVGDGVTDDAAAIQAAIDAGAGRRIILPGGDYLIKTKLTLPTNTSLHGVGRATKIIGDNLTTALLSSPNTAVRYFGWDIQNLFFDNTSKATGGGIGIDVTNQTLGHFSNVHFGNVELGIYVEDEAFYNNFFAMQMSDVVTGVHLMSGPASGANENAFYSLRVNACTTGAIVDDCTNNVFYKPAIEVFTTGFDIAPTGATQFIAIHDPRFEGGTTGIVNGATAQATMVFGGMVATVGTRYTNAAAEKEFSWLANDVAAWQEARINRLMLCGLTDNANVLVYSDNANRVFIRNTVDTAYSNLWLGELVANNGIEAAAGTTVRASLRLKHGVAPTVPDDGDMWTTTTGLFVHINGVTKTVTLT